MNINEQKLYLIKMILDTEDQNILRQIRFIFETNSKENTEKVKPEKPLNAKKYKGDPIVLKESPLEIQKKMRSEWD